MCFELGESRCHQVKRFIPSGGFEFAGSTVLDKRRGQAIGTLHEIEGARAPFHAQTAAVRSAICRFRIHDLAVFHHQVVLASRGTMRASRERFGHFPFAISCTTFLRERARGARTRTRAAALARRCLPVGTERRLNSGTRAFPARHQRMVARNAVAGAHAALTCNAQVRVETQEGVAVKDGFLRQCGFRDQVFFNAESAAKALQFACAVLDAGQALRAMVRHNELKCHFASGAQARRVGDDLHAVDDRRVACGNKRLLPRHFAHAHAATANVAHVFQKA